MKLRIVGKCLIYFCCMALCVILPGTAALAADGSDTVDALHVEDGKLVDAAGQAVQLRGVSTHGLTWFPDFVSAELFSQLSDDWGANLVRLAMYSNIYCNGGQEESLALMKKGIDAAISFLPVTVGAAEHTDLLFVEHQTGFDGMGTSRLLFIVTFYLQIDELCAQVSDM